MKQLSFPHYRSLKLQANLIFYDEKTPVPVFQHIGILPDHRFENNKT